jgi:hypothetical protein
MPKKSTYTVASAAILNNVLSLLNKGDDISSIITAIQVQHGIAPRTINRYLARARELVATIGNENAEIAKSKWRARIEQQYRDSYLIEDVDKRLRRQAEISALGIKLSGADQVAPRSVNVFNFYPGSSAGTKTAIDTEYTVDADTIQTADADTIQTEPEDDRPVWAMA